jgi:hypothetical protein
VTLTRRAHHGSIQHLLAASEPNSPATPLRPQMRAPAVLLSCIRGSVRKNSVLRDDVHLVHRRDSCAVAGHTWLPMRLRAAVLHTETVQLDRG